jgi:hypothetical protein
MRYVVSGKKKDKNVEKSYFLLIKHWKMAISWVFETKNEITS